MGNVWCMFEGYMDKGLHMFEGNGEGMGNV